MDDQSATIPGGIRTFGSAAYNEAPPTAMPRAPIGTQSRGCYNFWKKWPGLHDNNVIWQRGDNQPIRAMPRTFDVYVPSAHFEGPVPVVINLHAMFNFDLVQELFSAMDNPWRANGYERAGYIAVFPSSSFPLRSAGWNPMPCDGLPRTDDDATARDPVQGCVDDFEFINDIMAWLDDYNHGVCADFTRVYVTGFSAGAIMADALACASRADGYLDVPVRAASLVSGISIPGQQDWSLECVEASRPSIPTLVSFASYDNLGASVVDCGTADDPVACWHDFLWHGFIDLTDDAGCTGDAHALTPPKPTMRYGDWKDTWTRDACPPGSEQEWRLFEGEPGGFHAYPGPWFGGNYATDFESLKFFGIVSDDAPNPNRPVSR